ncbi:MAG TPA: OmpH family outer membrane protein [Pyrinomonadaceae bacterium]|nr:OmpH family outer membrane protein [Pyrinomonadaceae bacterium]
MNFNRFLALVFVAAFATGSVMAQTRPAAAQPKPAVPTTAATAPDNAGPVPDAKIAVIYSEAFLDAKIGISRFNTLMSSLNREFAARDGELKQLEAKITALQDELAKIGSASAVVSPESIRAKQDQLEQLKKDYQRKGEDAQAAYTKRRGEMFQPLNDDIGKALEVYAKAHNINVIIDGSQVPFVYAADAIDITRPFIIEFNTKNPATAALTPPK